MKINTLQKSLEIYKNNCGLEPKINKEKNSENDKFTISEEGRYLQAVLQALAKTPDVREDKVLEIKNKIEAGSYSISSEDVASKILDLDS